MQAQASKADAIVVLNAGADLSNALKQAAEFGITKKGQAVSVFGMTINSVSAMGLEVAQGLQITAPFYWDQNDDTRAWTKRFLERNKGVLPTYIMAGNYSATMHYLKAVQAAGTDDGKAVMARMKSTPINDFSMKNVRIREDGQTLRPVYIVQVKTPAESKNKNDLYSIKGEIPAEQPAGEPGVSMKETAAVKTVANESGLWEMHGDEPGGFEIRRAGRSLPTRFKTLDEAEMALEMFNARQRRRDETADYIDEA
jgi:hypothetical protein